MNKVKILFLLILAVFFICSKSLLSKTVTLTKKNFIEVIVKAKFGMISDNAELIVKGEIEGFIKINGVEKKVFNIKPSSNGAYLESTNGLMTTKLAPGDKVVGKFNKARYKKGNDIVVEDLYVVKTSTGYKLAVANSVKPFNHSPTSGVIIDFQTKDGTFLVGSFNSDLDVMLREISYPVISDFNLIRPSNNPLYLVPNGQKFNMLNVSKEVVDYFSKKGGFFNMVNAKWIDAAVHQSADILIVSKTDELYKSAGELTGFGKEVHRLEWKHGYRFDPSSKMMVPPSKAQGLNPLTLSHENIIIN